MADRTHAAIILSTAIGLACLAASPLIGALATALVERIAGLAYSLSDPGRSVVRIAGALLSGVAISAVVNGIVFTAHGGQFGHGRVFLVTFGIAVAAYAAILAGRVLMLGDLEAAFAVREWQDGYLRLATGLYLIYGPAVAVGYAAVYGLFHLGFRPAVAG